MSSDNASSRPSTGPGLRSIPPDPGLCRNITIHGYCKWQDKGCKFNHGEPKAQDGTAARLRPQTPTFTPGASSLVGALNAASFTPNAGSTAAATSIGAGAPVFVPRGTTISPTRTYPQESNKSSAFTSPVRYAGSQTKPMPQALPYTPMDNSVRSSNLSNNETAYQSQQVNPYEQPSNDLFYQDRQAYQQLQYHLYASLPPNRKSLAKNERTAHDFFMNDTLRESLQRKQAAALQTLSNSNLPTMLHSYHTLVPIDIQAKKEESVLMYPSTVYKAYSRQDGMTYALRRLEGFKLVNEASIGLVEKWRKVTSASIVGVKEAFTTRSFGDDSIVFVYDYYPLSSTLYDLHFGRSTRKFAPSSLIGEKLIWSYLTQLINGVRCVHAAGLACKTIHPSKILITDKNRLRINCCGVLDVVAYDSLPSLETQQQQDIADIGRVILAIAMNDAAAFSHAQTIPASRGYTNELTDLIHRFSQTDDPMTLEEAMLAISKHSMQNLDAALCYNDTLESELARESENGRLVRLLCKFGFILERPEFEHDTAWSETGERHVLKLFRDHVFHQVDEQGRPVVDLGHVLANLNKLDAGIEERLNLVTRDEQTSVIITYRELKRCAESAWQGIIQHHKNGR